MAVEVPVFSAAAVAAASATANFEAAATAATVTDVTDVAVVVPDVEVAIRDATLPDSSVTPGTSAAPRPKSKRFRFNAEFELVLLRAVEDTGAHLLEYGQGEALFEKVLEKFVSSHEYFAKENNAGPGGLIPPKLKTEFGEREQLLDTIIEEMDSKAEQDRVEKDAKQARELHLQKSGVNVRDIALKRMSEEEKCGEKTSSKKQKRVGNSFNLDYDNVDAELKLMQEEAACRRMQDAKKLELEERAWHWRRSVLRMRKQGM
eukprot:IDg1549t1